MDLEKDGKGSIFFRPWSGAKSLSHFFLEKEDAGGKEIFGFESLKENGRRYRIGQIPGQLDFSGNRLFCLQKRKKIDAQHILFQNIDIFTLFFHEIRDERVIFLDGDNLAAPVSQKECQRTFSGADLDNELILLGRDDGDNFVQDSSAGEKMLSESLCLSHRPELGSVRPYIFLNFMTMTRVSRSVSRVSLVFPFFLSAKTIGTSPMEKPARDALYKISRTKDGPTEIKSSKSTSSRTQRLKQRKPEETSLTGRWK